MNTLKKIFRELNEQEIEYCIRGRYKHLPEKLDGGDVDLLIRKKDFSRALNILKNKHFIFYPFTEPNLFYYLYDEKLGLIQLDILLSDKMIPIKKFKSFYIPENGKPIGNKKKFSKRIKTGIRRRLHFLFRGKLICFVGPDGSGKTTMRDEAYSALKKFPLKKEKIHFGAGRISFIKRLIDRISKISKVYFNIFLGRITITDRYLYLTFRNNKILRKIIPIIAPKPSLVFIMDADYKTLKKRRGTDSLTLKEVKELYRLFNKIDNTKRINTNKPLKKNLTYILNEILALYK